ncbi:alpha-1,2-mannosidase [Paenibacillus sp. 598K]|uniref:GH92 family glycosyl hydrolase n=1 Tax=Paenibacillus sp. 598K TaxID=1117987 RepID=UPI000FF9E20E|nr:GH92 family glycosyl hydrolase [Paenibacillus sp. 598K]GBF74286.1 alpha-1,2-mannosidase [Paenibacillus sp. 598K]
MRKKWIAWSILLVMLMSILQPLGVRAESGQQEMDITAVPTRNLALEAVSVLATGACNDKERAVFAVDGNTKTKWCDSSSTSIGKWLMLDLGESFTINQWIVKNNCMAEGNQCPNWNAKNFRLQKSEDGKTWIDVDVIQDNVQTIVDRYVPAFDAQYVRLYITKGAADRHTVRIAEFEVYGVKQGQLPAYPATDIAPVDYVDPFINTLGDNGQTNPGPRTPFGLAAPGPDSDGGAFSGYYYEDQAIKGFSHLRFSGVGCSGAGGNILLMPTTKSFTTSSSVYKDGYDKTSEQASAGYYAVTFDSGIRAELTASDNVGYHRYTFPEKAETGAILVDLSNSYAGMNHATLKVEGNEVSGMIESRNVCGHGYYKLYYSMAFDQDVVSYTSWSGASTGQVAERTGASSGVWLNFNTAEAKTVQVKVGLSTVGMEQARAERDYEDSGWAFDARHQAARDLWSQTLGKVQVTDDDEENKRIFYTQLYHAMQHPNKVSGKDGKFRAARDEQTLRDTSEISDKFEYYNGWSTWDDFRKYPLYSILEPQRFENMALSMIDLYKTRGSYAQWGAGYWPSPTVRNEFNGAVILDAIAKGLKLDDQELRLVMEGMAEDTDQYEVKNDQISGKLEQAYSAYYPMRLAEMLGDLDAYNKYYAIAKSYQALWNGDQSDDTGVERGFFTPNGNTVQPKDIKTVNKYAYQGNLWTYRWTVPHDMNGMAELMGGKRQMAEDLQHFFAIDEFVAVNEPDLHVPFLFNYTGMPYLTQYYAREYTTEVVTQKYHNHGLYGAPMVSRVFRSDPEGYLQSMDDDAGALSSWFVFSAMGLFPSNPGDPYYTIGSPIFEEVKLNLDHGQTFTIRANGVSSTNRFIQSATLNGETFDQPWILHADIMAGGSLVFEMGAEPNYAWGAAPEAAPPVYDFGEYVERPSMTKTLIPENAQWAYLDAGRYAGAGWTDIDYDDSDWKRGSAPLGYDNNDYVQTVVSYGPDSKNKYPTTYFRHTFEVEDVAQMASLAARLIHDDGAIIYLNGEEIIRTNMSEGAVGYDTYANATVGNERNWLTYEIDPKRLVDGTNVIAAEVHQVNESSSDIAYAFVLEASRRLMVPDAPTAPVVDNEARTFGWTYVPGFEQPELYEYSIDNGQQWRQASRNPQTIGPADHPAGTVLVRVAADPSREQAAGAPLRSDKPFDSKQLWDVYDLEVKTSRIDQLQVKVTGKRTGDYDQDAYVVFQLMDGGEKAWMTNAVPVGKGDFSTSQTFNVKSESYKVNVYLVDEYGGDIYRSVWLAEPAAPQPERNSEGPGQPGKPELDPLPLPEKPERPVDAYDPEHAAPSVGQPEAPLKPDSQAPEQPGDTGIRLEFESRSSWSEAVNAFNNKPLKTESGNNGTVVGNTFTGAWLAFEGIDFGEQGVNQIAVVYDAPVSRTPADIALEIRTSSPDGPLAGIVQLPRTDNGWGQYRIEEALLDVTLQGIQDLYLVMRGTTTNDHLYIGNFDSIAFSHVPMRADYAMLELERYDEWSTAINPGNNQPLKTENGKSGKQVANTYDGAWLAYKNMNFGISGVNYVSVEYAGNRGNTAADARVEVRLGDVSGPLLATIDTPPTADGWGVYAEAGAALTESLTGTKDIYFVMRGTTNGTYRYIGNYDNVRFQKQVTPVEPPVEPPAEESVQLEFESAERSQAVNGFNNR